MAPFAASQHKSVRTEAKNVVATACIQQRKLPQARQCRSTRDLDVLPHTAPVSYNAAESSESWHVQLMSASAVPCV